MVQTVTDAQGQAHEFPDEATPAMISGALGVQSPPPPQQPYQGGILPFSQDAQGNTSFDINQGITGALIRAFTAPGDAYAGKFDPMSPEGVSRALETALTFSPGSVAVNAGERAIAGNLTSTRRKLQPAPSADELRTAASSGYDAARATGAEYPGTAISDLAANAQNGLHNDGILAELAPHTHAVLNELQNPPAGSVVTISSLDAVRKALGRIAGEFGNPTEQEAARRVIGHIDDFITNAGPSANPAAGGSGSTSLVVRQPSAPGSAGGANGTGLGGGGEDPLTQAARLIQEARGNAAAAFRSDRITSAQDAADLRAAATASGQNGGNALRQRIASILLNEKQSRGFSPDELGAMRQVVEGTAASNVLRRVSNMLGGGGGIGHSLVTTLGGAIGAKLAGPAGAGVGAGLAAGGGAATRSAYNSLVGRQVRAVDDLIRQRSPLAQQNPGILQPSLWDVMTGAGTRAGLLGLLPPPDQPGLLGN